MLGILAGEEVVAGISRSLDLEEQVKSKTWMERNTLTLCDSLDPR